MPSRREYLDAEQLRALGDVHELFEEARIDYWLFGGWAVDFYVGSVTRPHADVDVFVWLKALPKLTRALASAGWRHVPSEDDDGGTGYVAGSVRLELTFLVRDEDGSIFTPLSQGRAPWPAAQFGDDVRELLGVRARVITFDSLKHGKSYSRDDPVDGAKDRADFALLSRLARGPV